MRVTRILISVGIAAWIAPAAQAEPAVTQLPAPTHQAQSVLMSQDPLTRQIIRQLTRENGGVKAVVRVANGTGVELKVAEPISMAGKDGSMEIPTLTPHPDLVKASQPLPEEKDKKKKIKQASKQLRTLKKHGKKQDWEGKSRKAKPSFVPIEVADGPY